MPFIVEGSHAGGSLWRDAPRNPGKAHGHCRADRRSGLRAVCLSSGSVWTAAARARAAAFLSSISEGYGVDGVHLHGHGELAQVAIVENAAARSYFKGALLLLLRALNVFSSGARLAARRDGQRWRTPKGERRHKQAKSAPASWAWRAGQWCAGGWLGVLPAWRDRFENEYYARDCATALAGASGSDLRKHGSARIRMRVAA